MYMQSILVVPIPHRYGHSPEQRESELDSKERLGHRGYLW